MATRYRLIIPPALLQAVIAQARAELPNECCGLLAGHLQDSVGTVTKRLPLVNLSASPREFSSEPHSMLQAEKAMRTEKLELLAIYHSHPTSPALPSQTDLERNVHGDNMVHLIISLEWPQAEVRAWWLGEHTFEPAEWRLA